MNHFPNTAMRSPRYRHTEPTMRIAQRILHDARLDKIRLSVAEYVPAQPVSMRQQGRDGARGRLVRSPSCVIYKVASWLACAQSPPLSPPRGVPRSRNSITTLPPSLRRRRRRTRTTIRSARSPPGSHPAGACRPRWGRTASRCPLRWDPTASRCRHRPVPMASRARPRSVRTASPCPRRPPTPDDPLPPTGGSFFLCTCPTRQFSCRAGIAPAPGSMFHSG